MQVADDMMDAAVGRKVYEKSKQAGSGSQKPQKPKTAKAKKSPKPEEPGNDEDQDALMTPEARIAAAQEVLKGDEYLKYQKFSAFAGAFRNGQGAEGIAMALGVAMGCALVSGLSALGHPIQTYDAHVQRREAKHELKEATKLQSQVNANRRKAAAAEKRAKIDARMQAAASENTYNVSSSGNAQQTNAELHQKIDIISADMMKRLSDNLDFEPAHLRAYATQCAQVVYDRIDKARYRNLNSDQEIEAIQKAMEGMHSEREMGLELLKALAKDGGNVGEHTNACVDKYQKSVGNMPVPSRSAIFEAGMLENNRLSSRDDLDDFERETLHELQETFKTPPTSLLPRLDYGLKNEYVSLAYDDDNQQPLNVPAHGVDRPEPENIPVEDNELDSFEPATEIGLV